MGYWEGGGEESSPGGDDAVLGSLESARKGPRRRYYRLTDRGLQALGTSVAEWQSFSDAIARVLGSGEGRLDPGFSG